MYLLKVLLQNNEKSKDFSRIKSEAKMLRNIVYRGRFGIVTDSRKTFLIYIISFKNFVTNLQIVIF